MAIPTYVEGFPPDGASLGATKAQIRSNLDGTFQTVNVNHFNNNSPNAGQHMFIQLPNSSVAPPVPNQSTEWDLYNGGGSIGGTNNIFGLPPGSASLSNAIQLTRNEKPVSATNGFSWLPGGILIQWGQFTFGTPSGSVNFNTNMSAIYSVLITVIGSPNSSATTVRVTGTTPGSPGSFSYSTNNLGGQTGFYWLAIGK